MQSAITVNDGFKTISDDIIFYTKIHSERGRMIMTSAVGLYWCVLAAAIITLQPKKVHRKRIENENTEPNSWFFSVLHIRVVNPGIMQMKSMAMDP